MSNIINPNMTAQEMLDAVNSAIITVLAGGQSYQIGSRKLTRADLKLLNEMKSELTTQIASQGNSSLLDDTVVAVFSGR